VQGVVRKVIISSSLFWLAEYYVFRSTDHKGPHYAVYSIALLHRPCQFLIFSSAPPTRSAYDLSSFHRLGFTSFLTYLLTPWRIVLLEKLTGLQLVKKFPAFYGNRMFITVFKSVRHLSPSWSSSIQAIPPHPSTWRSILILSSHLRLSFTTIRNNRRNYSPLEFNIYIFGKRTFLCPNYHDCHCAYCEKFLRTAFEGGSLNKTIFYFLITDEHIWPIVDNVGCVITAVPHIAFSTCFCALQGLYLSFGFTTFNDSRFTAICILSVPTILH